MRMMRLAFFGVVVALLGGVTAPRAQVDASISVNFGELNDYGEWAWMQGYGTVWRPYADPGWRPFMYGHWSYTDDGWLWDADEPFGWIVCHYGNWTYDDEMGWVWVPGYDWSPARVEWHVTDREIAWAPLFPPPLPGHIRVEVSSPHWMFCPVGLFGSVEVYSHVQVRARPSHNTANVTVTRVAPRFEFVRRASRTPIVRVSPRRVSVTRPGHALVRVEVTGRPEHTRVVVPVGAQYKRVVVRSQPEPRATVTVTHDEEARTVVRPAEPATRVTVTHSDDVSRTVVRPAEPSTRVTVTHDDNVRTVVPAKRATVKSSSNVKVRVKSKDGNDQDEDDDNVRVKVQVHSK